MAKRSVWLLIVQRQGRSSIQNIIVAMGEHMEAACVYFPGVVVDAELFYDEIRTATRCLQDGAGPYTDGVTCGADGVICELLGWGLVCAETDGNWMKDNVLVVGVVPFGSIALHGFANANRWLPAWHGRGRLRPSDTRQALNMVATLVVRVTAMGGPAKLHTWGPKRRCVCSWHRLLFQKLAMRLMVSQNVMADGFAEKALAAKELVGVESHHGYVKGSFSRDGCMDSRKQEIIDAIAHPPDKMEAAGTNCQSFAGNSQRVVEGMLSIPHDAANDGGALVAPDVDCQVLHMQPSELGLNVGWHGTVVGREGVFMDYLLCKMVTSGNAIAKEEAEKRRQDTDSDSLAGAEAAFWLNTGTSLGLPVVGKDRWS
eukprot:jgi/Psemu1/23813/gm1.23813_g